MKKTILLTALILTAALLLLTACDRTDARWENTLQEAQGNGEITQGRRVNALLHNDGTWQLVVALDEVVSHPTTLTIEGIDGEVFGQEIDDMAISAPLQTDAGYIVTIERNGESAQGIVRFNRDEWLSIDGQTQSRDVRNFQVIAANGRNLGEFESVFHAMEQTFRRTGAQVKEDGGRVVFTEGEANAIFLFQHTRFINVVYDEISARDFLDNHPFTHAVRSDGSIFDNSYRFFATDERYEPDPHMWEPNSGGYTYKVPYSFNGFRRVTTVIDLSQARFRKSDRSGEPGQGFNAYIFFALQNATFTVDAGIYAGYANDGVWRVFMANKDGGLTDFGPIVEADYDNGSWIPRDDVRITIWYSDGMANMEVENLTTGQIVAAEIVHPEIGGNAAFISGTSFVPANLSYRHTPDWRNGGYLLNVIYSEKYLQRTGARLGEFENFSYWYGSPETFYYFFLYQDDTCHVDFLRNSNGDVIGEVINIDYRFWDDRDADTWRGW
ncbi:MAG: hypothetical protein FWE06_01150 [Oscillospiraceae bacterium]|nr:hypothetical protein [Oscillospiraceae bacterium]